MIVIGTLPPENGNPTFTQNIAAISRAIDRMEGAMREALVMLRSDPKPSAWSVDAAIRLHEALYGKEGV